MRRVLWLVTLVGCASYPLPEGNSRFTREWGDWARGYGCTQETGEALVRATNHQLKKGLEKPEVGWDACQLMFTNGRPDQEEFQETEEGKYRSWWYHEHSSVHLVNLTLRPSQAGATRSPWVVTYVGW